MQVCKYLPVASDRMGIIWTLSSIDGICVLEFGPSGTTHYAIEAIGSLNGSDRAKIYSTHMDESDITFGKYDRLEKAIIEIDENIKPKYIFVMNSSVSSIIGTDIESVCDLLFDKVNAKLIPITTGGLKGDYNVGVESILYTLAKEVVCDFEKDNNKYNIIGFNIDKYNFESDINELKRMMKEYFNKELNTVFTCNTSSSEIEKASIGSINIVVRKEGLKCAKFLKDKYNIPYIYKNLYGVDNIDEFIKEISQIEGFNLNESIYEKEKNEVKSHLFRLKMKLRSIENRKCAVIGDFDTVVGLSSMLNSFGFDVCRKEVLYTEESEEVISNVSESDRMIYLKNTELFGLFADGASLDMKHNSVFDIQISNPNLNKVNIYHYKPFIGLRGVLYIIERLMNLSFDL